MQRIAILESMRGLMALWVVFGHVFRHAGFTEVDLGLIAILARPGYAVDVFIILSGFVIFLLLDREPLTYRSFIVRRFFRLAPLYGAVLLASVVTLAWQIDVLKTLPWRTEPLQGSLELRLNAAEHFWPQLVAHLTMLHGLVDHRILPSSSYAFIGQAWSISVEWQFYIVAPFLFALVVARRWYVLASVLATLCVIRFTNYGGEGFAVRQAGYFLVGILSFYAYRRLAAARLDPRMIDAAAVIGGTAIYMLIARSTPLVIWAAMLALLLAERQTERTAPQRIGSAILNHPALLWLGLISYSVYLVHVFPILAGLDLIFRFAPDIGHWQMLSLLMPFTIAATLALSWATYVWIERPGIRCGSVTSRALASATATPKVVPADAYATPIEARRPV